ncbi:MAG: AmmeMemoRadiSam system protein B [Candidatus Heimdallarchaeaceae archaeon]
MMKRKAQYAGSFYLRNPEALEKSIKECFLNPLGPGKLPSEISEKIEEPLPFILVPHAGYIYSGPVAAWSYLELCKYETPPDTIILLGPNHTGMGSEIAVPDQIMYWETPLGDVQINHDLIDKLIASNPHIKKSDISHAREHSIEVQLPFLQYILDESFQIVPICLLNQGMDASLLLGETIGKVCQDESIIVVASSDFTHFEHNETAYQKDGKVLEAIQKMDIKAMYDIKYSLHVTMCGYGPIAATMEAAKKLGRTKCKILKYATSGDSSGMKDQVVGYGSAIFYHEKNG